MGFIDGEKRAPPRRLACVVAGEAGRERAQAIHAFKQAIDALFEADSAERAPSAVRRLLAIAQRPSLRLAALDGHLLSPHLAPGRAVVQALASAGIERRLARRPPSAAFAAVRGEAAPRGEGRSSFPAGAAEGAELGRLVTSC